MSRRSKASASACTTSALLSAVVVKPRHARNPSACNRSRFGLPMLLSSASPNTGCQRSVMAFTRPYCTAHATWLKRSSSTSRPPSSTMAITVKSFICAQSSPPNTFVPGMTDGAVFRRGSMHSRTPRNTAPASSVNSARYSCAKALCGNCARASAISDAAISGLSPVGICHERQPFSPAAPRWYSRQK